MTFFLVSKKIFRCGDIIAGTVHRCLTQIPRTDYYGAFKPWILRLQVKGLIFGGVGINHLETLLTVFILLMK